MVRTLRGRRVLITGASSGIGREMAIALAAAGARLLITSNQREPLSLLAETLSPSSPDLIQVHGDITSPDDRSLIFAAARDHFGGLDILINNAGVGGNAPFLDEDPSVLRRIMEVNFFALAECCRAGIPLLVGGQQPLIVNLSSMFGRRAVPSWSSYCASKFAVCGLSESLRSELAGISIDLMVVLPAVIHTDFGVNLISGAPLDLAGALDARAVALEILSGIRRNRSELLVGRDAKWLIGLNRLFPNRLFPTWLDRKLIVFARLMPNPTERRTMSLPPVSAGNQRAIDWRSWRARRIELVRAAERLFPKAIFHAVISPFVLRRSIRDARKAYALLLARHREPRALYRSVTPLKMFGACYQSITANLLRHFPERLGEPRWQRRCRWVGDDYFQAALATGRPLILATVHYGPLPILYHWLRSRGLPVAAMTVYPYRDEYRVHYDTLGDIANGLPDIPALFGTSMDDLYAVRDFLSQSATHTASNTRAPSSRALLMSIDGTAGSHPLILELDDMQVHLHLGTFSIASMTHAIVLPCLYRISLRTGSEIHFGPPVPDELLARRRTYSAAAKHVVDHLMPLVRECPEQGLLVGLNVGAKATATKASSSRLVAMVAGEVVEAATAAL